MYVHLAWAPLNNTPPDEVEGEILAHLVDPSFRFVDVYTPWDGCFVASIKKGNTPWEVQLLHNELVKAAANKFSYVITISKNQSPITRSADQTDPIYAKLESYVT